ncbi:MAG: hypothetical protein P8K80_01040 [Phycisphaerales bacterium]|nr:hypothetical protein [Phycisphaerales bacterium]
MSLAADSEALSSEPSSNQVSTHRLAIELLRYGNDIMLINPVTVESIELAKYFFQEAARLHPRDPQVTVRLMEMAILAEDQKLIESATKAALTASPENQVVQLRRLLQAVDRYQYAEERVSAYELLLSDANQKMLGDPMSSRIALKLAMLYRRMGDLDQFSNWLGRSIIMDPSYSEAVAMGAGYFQTKVNDRLASVELLVSLLLADPTDSTTPAVLAHLLMEEGAYTAARRMYHLAINDVIASGIGAQGDLLADLAIAEWACGDREAALGVIQSRQQDANEIYRALSRRDSPDLSPIDLARMEAPLTPTLATVRAVIENEAGGDVAADALSSLIETYQSGMSILASQKGTEKEQAWSLIELSWLVLWLDGDVEDVAKWLDQAQKLADIDAEAIKRFDGWISFRRGFDEDAALILEPLSEEDSAARLGMALIREHQGRKQDAARLLLSLTRSEAGSILGIWSRDRLTNLLGAEVPMTDSAVELTKVIDSIPSAIDRYPQDPRLAISIDVEPRESTIGPYDPVIIEIELMNHSSMPLAISGEGPIRELMLLEPIVQVPHQSPMSLAPIVIDLGGRLRLEGYERITIPFDLRTTWVGTLLNQFPVDGASILTTGILNFQVSNNTSRKLAVFAPGLLGSEVTGKTLHVEGVRVTEEWVAAAIGSAQRGVVDSQLLADLSILTHMVRNSSLIAEKEIDQELIGQVIPTIAELFPGLDEVQKAWFMSVASSGELMNPIKSIVMQGNQSLPKMIVLLRLLENRDPSEILANPMLTSSLRSGNDRIKQLAEWVEQRAQFSVESEIQQQSRDQKKGVAPAKSPSGD